MIASQTVYLAADQSTPVAEGDPRAKSLLVRKGCDIPQTKAELYEGAVELIGGTKEVQQGLQHRDPLLEKRDPEVTEGAARRGRPRKLT